MATYSVEIAVRALRRKGSQECYVQGRGDGVLSPASEKFRIGPAGERSLTGVTSRPQSTLYRVTLRNTLGSWPLFTTTKV